MSFEFNLGEVEEFSGGVIPAGQYLATVEEAELKETKDGNGLYINCQFTVVDENHNGRKFWDTFNIKNANEKAVQIGLGRIKSLIVAAGGEPGLFNDEQALVGLETLVKLKAYTDDYGEKNEVVNYSPAPNVAPGEPTTGEIPKGADGKPVF